MKKIFSVLLLAAVCTAAFAQRVSYKDIKHDYKASNYVRSTLDPYSVFWTGLESFGAPGVGQFIMREPGHGWAFVFGAVATAAPCSFFLQKYSSYLEKDANDKWYIPDAVRGEADKYLIGAGCAALGFVCVQLWSCIDAVKIAKVKNQFYQDASGRHASAKLLPSVDFMPTGTGLSPVAGMTLALNF